MRYSLDEVLERAGAYFMGASPIHRAARRLARALREMEVPFAFADALAVNAHGHIRTSEDVDVLLTPVGLRQFKDRWLGRGWVDRSRGSKGLRDAVENVKVDILLAGEYPGDGKPKPVVFPDPEAAADLAAGELPVLKLPVLLELKLASGMTAPHRIQDLADVIQLIRRNALRLEYGETLDSFVREKYAELWEAAQVEDDY